jgi:SAM-dependent methyltransferase
MAASGQVLDLAVCAPSDDAAASWDGGALGWDQHREQIHVWLADATADMLDAACIRPGMRVLDVAAGAGDQTLEIALRVGVGGQVLATDISAQMITRAETRLRVAGHSQVQTRLADMQQLGLAGAEFDAAVCRMGLMFCTEPLQALREIRSALAPGAQFSALVFSDASANPCITTLTNTARRHAGLSEGDAYAAGTLLSLGCPGLLSKLLTEAGFIHGVVRTLAAPFRLASNKDYINFVRSAGSPIIDLLKTLSVEQQACAWDDITAQLARFETAHGWQGPNELLLCSAKNP